MSLYELNINSSLIEYYNTLTRTLIIIKELNKLVINYNSNNTNFSYEIITNYFNQLILLNNNTINLEKNIFESIQNMINNNYNIDNFLINFINPNNTFYNFIIDRQLKFSVLLNEFIQKNNYSIFLESSKLLIPDALHAVNIILINNNKELYNYISNSIKG
jgi:hypothetical protein